MWSQMQMQMQMQMRNPDVNLNSSFLIFWQNSTFTSFPFSKNFILVINNLRVNTNTKLIATSLTAPPGPRRRDCLLEII